MIEAGKVLRTKLIPWGLWAAFGFLILGGLGSRLEGWGAVLPPALAGAVRTAENLTAVFLGIFIEAAPFLLLGTLASGLVEVFVDRAAMAKLLPRSGWGAALGGSLLGLFFPVCECGVVPLTRRLFQKGLPLPMGVAFLLAAPVINPIVMASTLAAFGPGLVFWGRLGLTFLIASLTGLIFSRAGEMGENLLPAAQPMSLNLSLEPQESSPVEPLLGAKIQRMLIIAVDEFFEMGRYLVVGAFLAAAMQTLVPRSALLGVSQGPLVSVVVMVALAVLLSICSTVDAFIALAFASTFTSGSVLAFLVFGPMVDIKSTLMFLRVFRKRTVAYLILLPLLMTLLAGTIFNLWAGG